MKLHRICTKCGNKRLKSEFGEKYCNLCISKIEEDIPTKFCIWCRDNVPITEFADMPDEEDKLDFLCSLCRIECNEYKKSMGIRMIYTNTHSEDVFPKHDMFHMNMLK